ncbi:MAG: putative metal-binding motif-containing protein [Deltaproteobacteria bacterium]|nr:putative metal-binding motif-containing protein [Deltaproteobacteria bacterium]
MKIRIGRRAALATATALAIGACGGDTGLLLEVTRTADAPAQIPNLRIYVGVADGQAAGAFFVDSADAQADVALAGRDLATDPYRLLLQAGDKLPATADLQVAAVGFRLDGTTPVPIAFGAIDHAVGFASGEILSYGVALGPADGAVTMSGLGCVDFAIGDVPVHIGAHDDWDCDGDAHATDCNDHDPLINHAATEICGNDVDEDCTDAIDDDTDRDGDGVSACKGDCIDNPAAPLPPGLTAADFHVGAPEMPGNRFDENCDHECDPGDGDADKDHYTTNGIVTVGAVAGVCRKGNDLIDCADGDKDIHPEATEDPQNGIDDDCDGTCDQDLDGDGFTPSGYVEPPMEGICAKSTGDGLDCDDDPANDPPGGVGAAMIHPGALEQCDGIDEDCDGLCDPDPDEDGYSTCGTVDPTGGACVLVAGACMPGLACDCAPDSGAAHPAGSAAPEVERCDGYDQNCDGVLYPMDQRCFAPGPAAVACLAGTRSCNDAAPAMPWGDCVTDPMMPVDPALCEAYATCFSDPSITDPYACAVDQSAIDTLRCDATTVVGNLCTPSTWLLPAPLGTGNCAAAMWSIIGGTHQGAWTVGLAGSSLGTSSATFTGCQPFLVVTGWDANLPGAALEQRVVITERANSNTGSLAVRLHALGGSACATESNLSCQ